MNLDEPPGKRKVREMKTYKEAIHFLNGKMKTFYGVFHLQFAETIVGSAV